MFEIIQALFVCTIQLFSTLHVLNSTTNKLFMKSHTYTPGMMWITVVDKAEELTIQVYDVDKAAITFFCQNPTLNICGDAAWMIFFSLIRQGGPVYLKRQPRIYPSFCSH